MNVTSTAATMIEGATVLDQVWKFLLATRAELFVFCAAVAANLLLFGNRTPKNSRPRNQKAKRIEVEDDLDDDQVHAKPSPKINAGDAKQLAESFHAAFDAGDHRQALQCWNLLKRFDAVPAVPVAQAVESMQRFKKDPVLVMRELKAFFSKHPTECNISVVNDLLESLTKRLDSDLVDKIVSMMPSMKVQPDQRTYEVRLTMHFTTRAFSEVQRLLAEMEKERIPCTTKATIVAVKAALKTGNFKEAMKRFKDLKSLWAGHGGEGATASMAPRHIISQLVDLACRDHQLAEVLPHLQGVPISEDAFSSMLSECIRQRDPELTKQVETLVRDQGHQLSDATYTLLVKSVSNDPARVQALFDEVVAKGATLSADFALALLAFCGQTRSMKLADRLFEHMKPKQVPVLSAFIRFYTDSEQYDKACDIYEEHLKAKPATPAAAAKDDSPRGQGLFLDVRTERSLMGAALRCGRQELAKRFLDASPMDVAKHITMIRDCASSGNLRGAMQVFETLRRSGTEVNGVVYNTVLDACVECNDLKAAEAWMAQTKKIGLADVVSYNTLIKAYLQNKDFTKARSLMEEMRQEGLQPNRVTFNELVNGLVTRGTQSQRAEIWGIVKEMKAAGVKPNQVTCSILLKSLNSHSRESDILETMDLISSMEEPMDEVLLSSVVEACVRIGKPELLSTKLKQLHSTESLSVTGSHTFGSLIKAYGHAKDIDGVWRCWKEMRSRHIRPTSITLGCMVEAVVSNGDTEGAYELIHQMQDDERCRDALNAVIYCSVLKGFTREKKMQRVWAVFEEMQSRKVEVSIVMYNTLLDACARCGRMDRVPAIVQDMQKHEIKANLITYSTMVKGHCQAGDIEQGFAILEQMKSEAGLKPDEIMYNSLLDGCAQNNLVDEGLKLLDKMQKEGVQPSNFTLSLLVKLMNRCRKLDNAFSLVDEISSKYRFSPNVHVYTNLIQACIANRQLQRGMTTFQRMLKERVQPESRTYCILVRASVSQNQLEQAAGLLRAALGLSGAHPFVAEAQARLASIHNLDYALVSEALQGLAEKGRGQDLAAPLLSDIKRCKPGIRIDSNVARRVMSAGISGDSAHHAEGNNYGGGYFERRRGGPPRGEPRGEQGGYRGGGRGRDGGRSERSW